MSSRGFAGLIAFALVAGCSTQSTQSTTTTEKDHAMPTSELGSFRPIHVFTFEFDSHELSQEFDQSLKAHAQYINTSGHRAHIQGSADNMGQGEYNYELGMRRAQAVKDALVSYGADPKLIIIGSIGTAGKSQGVRRALITY